MKQKLVITFYNENGDVVPELSKDPASFNDVTAALQFLCLGKGLTVAVVECDEKGKTI